MGDAAINDASVPISEIRTVAARELTNAITSLQQRRYEKVRLNLAKEDVTNSSALSSPHDKNKKSRSSRGSSSIGDISVAAKALNAIGTLNVPAGVMLATRKLPKGIQWIRARTNVRLPESFHEEAFVPYLGESDEHLKSSSKLANMLFDGESDKDDDSDVEGMEVDSSSEEDNGDDEDEENEDDAITPSSGSGNGQSARHQTHLLSDSKSQLLRRKKEASQRQRSSRVGLRKGSAQYPRSGKLYAYEGKVSEYRWERAAKRLALKRMASSMREQYDSELKRSDDDSVSNFARAIREAFRMETVKHVRAYLHVVRKREDLWDKKVKGERQLDSMRKEVVNLAKGIGNPRPADVLKGDSIQFFFCRRCYVYDCSLHGCQTAGPSKTIPDRTRKDSASKQIAETIENSCEDRRTGDCFSVSPKEEECATWYSQFRDSNPDLNDDVQSLLKLVLPIFGKDFCRVAHTMRTFLREISETQMFTCNRVGHIAISTYTEMLKKPSQSRSKPLKHRAPIPLMESKAMNGGTRPEFVPCVHDGPCTKSNCSCVQGGVHCEKYCGCNHLRPNQSRAAPSCNWAFPGCSCKSAVACASNACLCFSWKRECDPDLCRHCHECTEEGDICCHNVSLRRRRGHRILAGRSEVHGWGVYASSDIKRNDLVGEYVGEVLADQHAERRGRVYDETSSTYLFEITNSLSLDSTRIGNKLRYCNHSDNPNCEPRLMRVGGDIRIGIFAKRDIQPHEELFFDYGEKFEKKEDWMKSNGVKTKRNKPAPNENQETKRVKRTDDVDETYRSNRRSMQQRSLSTPSSSKAVPIGERTRLRRSSRPPEWTAPPKTASGTDNDTQAVRTTGRTASSLRVGNDGLNLKSPHLSKVGAEQGAGRVEQRLGAQRSSAHALESAANGSAPMHAVNRQAAPKPNRPPGSRIPNSSAQPTQDRRTLAVRPNDGTAPGSGVRALNGTTAHLHSNTGIRDGGPLRKGALNGMKADGNPRRHAPWQKFGSASRGSEKALTVQREIAKSVSKGGARRTASSLRWAGNDARADSKQSKPSNVANRHGADVGLGIASTPSSKMEDKKPSSVPGTPKSNGGNQNNNGSVVIDLLSDDDSPSQHVSDVPSRLTTGNANGTNVDDGDDSDGCFNPIFGKFRMS